MPSNMLDMKKQLKNAKKGKGPGGADPIPGTDNEGESANLRTLAVQGGDEAGKQAAGAPTSNSKICHALTEMFITKLNLLLVFVPLGIACPYVGMTAGPTFLANFLAVIPLASVLGHSTEALAAHTGQMIGGFLNATFGNAVEMMVTINALRAGLVHVVQGSLIGSVLSNLLLVLGMAFVASAYASKEAGFNAQGAAANTTCLVLASLGLTLPTVYTHMPDTTFEDQLMLSRLGALVMASTYVLFLVFQLKTHADLFAAEEEEEEADLPAWIAGLILFLTTCCVAVSSEYLVGSIEGVSEEYGMPSAFIGIILLPIVGNAAEHMTAVTMAAKGKMDLTIGVAVGSSTQIALFVVPFSVLIGWGMGVDMTLDFDIFMSTVFVLSVFIAQSVLSDGSANWFEGSMLIATYLLVALICWFLPSGEKHSVHGAHHAAKRLLSGAVTAAPSVIMA
eukprot:TRINITY_DN1248_c0_g1_i2.p1 TRINITY_DN1248_c0_g1~~TRINITY_DN1248_c0_g1_i2.p1  ORF type:complete len:450 (+),score=81.16 TRINITY_DN1248_c0_g1_i2:126-1475(+)